MTSLAQLGAVTSRIRIGTSIVPIFARTPSNLAMTALNMDVMTEGRFFLGLGASGRLVIEDFHGEEFRKPLTRMREYIAIIRKAMRGERLDHDGEFFQTQRFRIRFKPYRDNLPIYIASLSPPSLRMTVSWRTAGFPSSWPPRVWARRFPQFRRAPSPPAVSLDDIAISPQVSVYVTDDIPAARDRERPHIAFYIGGMGVFYHQYMHRIGFGEESDMIREAYLSRDRDRAASLVTDEMVDEMTIIGDPDQCRDQMQKYFEAGVDEIRLVLNEPDAESYVRTMKALAPNS